MIEGAPNIEDTTFRHAYTCGAHLPWQAVPGSVASPFALSGVPNARRGTQSKRGRSNPLYCN